MSSLCRSPSSFLRALPSLRRLSTISSCLYQAVDRLPHTEALRSSKQDVRWSYKELNVRVEELANGFVDLQFERNDVVAMWLPNNVEKIMTQLAIACAGLIAAIIDSNVTQMEDLAFILHDSQASGLVFDSEQHGRNEMIQELFPELMTFRDQMEVFRPKKFRHLHSVITTSWEPSEGMINLNGMMVNSPEPYTMKAIAKTLSDKTPFAVAYSKEKEGQHPIKSAMLTHGDVVKQAETLATSLKIAATDKILLTGEKAGLCLGSFAAISQNSQIVLPSSEIKDGSTEKALEVDQCSIVGSGFEHFKRV